MPDTGVLRVLTSQQRATGWRRQVEVEKSLGLEKGQLCFEIQYMMILYRGTELFTRVDYRL